MIAPMISDLPTSETTENRNLREILPPTLWKALARNGIQTIKDVIRSYPEQLLIMPHIGPRKFRLIEKLLFPGYFYEPITGDVEHDLQHAARHGTVLRRAQGTLRRFDLKVTE